MTRVIDRLEQSGYVRRVPDPDDRRKVIVEVVPEKVAAVQSTLDRVGAASAEEIGRYTDAQLALITDFLGRMEQITRDEATSLREHPELRATRRHPSTRRHSAAWPRLASSYALASRRCSSDRALRRPTCIAPASRGRPPGPPPRRSGHRPVPRRAVRLAQATGRHRPQRDDPVVAGDRRWGRARRRRPSRGRAAALPADRWLAADRARPRGAERRGRGPGRRRVGEIRVDRPGSVPVRLRVSGGSGQIVVDGQTLSHAAARSPSIRRAGPGGAPATSSRSSAARNASR